MTPKKPIGDAGEASSVPPTPTSTPTPPLSPVSSDVALIHGVAPDGNGFQIVRARDNRVELGIVRPLREGAPITGDVVTLRPRPNFPALCDVETHYKPALPTAPVEGADSSPPLLAARTGPAQVATDEYRRNWDAIWSKPTEKAKLSN
ncbi:MAG: hypothetical protein WDO56_01870 [Gammaproteobacteria bacterium]